MQTRNVPATGPGYWTALSVASVFGANMGDFCSKILHLGHANGLLPLAILFAAILAVERRAIAATVAFYWLAVIVLRTAATNAGDLLTHDFAIPYPAALAGLAALLAAILVVERPSPTVWRNASVPDTNLYYWAAMMVAGTLGTAAGDYVADVLGLGAGGASLALCVVLATVLTIRTIGGFTSRASYWITIVAIRSAGTTVGDYLAGRHGLDFGLPISTAATGLVFVTILAALFYAKPPNAAAA